MIRPLLQQSERKLTPHRPVRDREALALKGAAMQQTTVDRQTFLSRLRQSGLLSAQEIQDGLSKIPETNRGKAVARGLVELGLLTKFQAELLLAGRTNGFFLGQYRILEQIGQGGMGRVFKAVHKTMGRTVALKVLAPQHTKTEKARQLFQREVRAAGKLLHPNIVTAYDANEVEGRHFLVMEYVDGPTLDQLVRERGPLPVGLACEIIRQAALGLQCAHEHGMVHRDIKPSNLLLQRPNGDAGPCVVKILDFGLARLSDPLQTDAKGDGTILTRDNTVMGTPDFLSPEQARDLHKVDIRSDLYSLGCTFYFLVTGQVPFPGGTSLDKLIRHGSEEPRPLDALRPEVPLVVSALVRRLMAKAPADRFQTPADVVTALTNLAQAISGSWSVVTARAAIASATEDTGARYDTSGIDFLEDSAPDLAPAATPAAWPTDPTPTPVAPRDEPAPMTGGAKNWLIWFLAVLCTLLGLTVVLLLLRP
jgi:serine/threonine-protein kinase